MAAITTAACSTACNRALVVGSGVIGLRSSLELLRRNVKVTLRSARPPLQSTSCGAGGLWMPFHCDDGRTDRWAIETLDELLLTENRHTEIVPSVMFKQDHFGKRVEHSISSSAEQDPLPEWTQDVRLQFQHLTIEMLWWQNRVHQLRLPSQQMLEKAGYKHAWLFHPPIVDSPKMLESMLDEIQSYEHADVNVDTGHNYGSVEEMVQDAVELECDAVVNCTGLGSRDLCKDHSVIGARGVLLQYDRNQVKHPDNNLRDTCLMTDDPPWGSQEEPVYCIPRGNIYVVGGTYLEGDDLPELRPSERKRLLENAKLLLGVEDDTPPVSEWTGFRPYRPTVRLEVDEEFSNEQVKVVHNYGHGGSGWTVYVGAAVEAANLITQAR